MFVIMDLTLLPKCAIHRKPKTRLCFKSHCDDYLLCSDCIAQHSCSGDFICLENIGDLVESMESLYDLYQARQADSETAIDHYFELAKSKCAYFLKKQFDRIRRKFCKYSAFTSFEKINDDLNEILTLKQEIVSGRFRGQMLDVFSKLRQFFSISNYSTRNNAILVENLKHYVEGIGDTRCPEESGKDENFSYPNCVEFTEKPKLFKSFDKRYLELVDDFDYLDDQAIGSISSGLDLADQANDLQKSKVKPQEMTVINSLKRLYHRQESQHSTEYSEAKLIQKFNEGQPILGIRRPNLLTISRQKRIFLFTGAVEQSEMQHDPEAQAKSNRHVFTGRLVEATHREQLGFVKIQQDSKLVRVFFVSQDDYLAVQLEDCATIYKVNQKGLRIELAAWKEFGTRLFYDLKPFVGPRFDLTMLKFGKYVKFWNIKTNEKIQKNIDAIDVNQTSENNFVYLNKKFELMQLKLDDDKKEYILNIKSLIDLSINLMNIDFQDKIKMCENEQKKLFGKNMEKISIENFLKCIEYARKNNINYRIPFNFAILETKDLIHFTLNEFYGIPVVFEVNHCYLVDNHKPYNPIYNIFHGKEKNRPFPFFKINSNVYTISPSKSKSNIFHYNKDDICTI